MICAPAAGRPAFRVGAWDRNGRKHSEDGADDHIADKTNSESVREKTGQAQSPSGEAARQEPDARISGEIRDASRKRSERTAVIARCGIRHRAACRSGGQGNNAR